MNIMCFFLFVLFFFLAFSLSDSGNLSLCIVSPDPEAFQFSQSMGSSDFARYRLIK